MEKKHRARLLKLARHLEKGKLGHRKFDFRVINHRRIVDGDWSPTSTAGVKPYSCGYAGCAMGECPVVFPRQWRFDKDASPLLRRRHADAVASCGTFDDATTFFGLRYTAASHLFCPNAQMTDLFGGRLLGERATRRQVASNIRSFVRKMSRA